MPHNPFHKPVTNPTRFSSKDECQAAIDAAGRVLCGPMFVSDHYAAAYGVARGGWYASTHQREFAL
jgi:hypothetical protein